MFLFVALSVSDFIKAGRLVAACRQADCYAVIVLADNATFLLAVNRMVVAFRTQSANRSHLREHHQPPWLKPVEHQNIDDVGSSPTWDRSSHMFVPISACAVNAGYPISVSVERATPILYSLRLSEDWPMVCVARVPWCLLKSVENFEHLAMHRIVHYTVLFHNKGG